MPILPAFKSSLQADTTEEARFVVLVLVLEDIAEYDDENEDDDETIFMEVLRNPTL